MQDSVKETEDGKEQDPCDCLIMKNLFWFPVQNKSVFYHLSAGVNSSPWPGFASYGGSR